MKYILLLLCLFNCSFLFAQKKICSCQSNPLIEESISCETTVLRNQSKLYYQFNCDSTWLTLENINGHKKIIYSMRDTEFHELWGYTYRLGYYLAKEFKNSLLFRFGCPANGSCGFNLIDKNNGKLLRNFNELIYDHDDSLMDFIVYFSDDTASLSLTLDFIDDNKKMVVPIPLVGKRFDEIKPIHPEYQFTKVSLSGEVLKLIYDYGLDEKPMSDSVIVDLRKYK